MSQECSIWGDAWHQICFLIPNAIRYWWRPCTDAMHVLQQGPVFTLLCETWYWNFQQSSCQTESNGFMWIIFATTKFHDYHLGIAVEPVLVVTPLVLTYKLGINIRGMSGYYLWFLLPNCHKHASIERFHMFLICWNTKMEQVLMIPQYPGAHRSIALNSDHPSVSHDFGISDNNCTKPKY